MRKPFDPQKWINAEEYIRIKYYSAFKLLTGFAIAAFIAWKLTVNKVMNKAPPIATAKIHQLISVRYSYFCNH